MRAPKRRAKRSPSKRQAKLPVAYVQRGYNQDPDRWEWFTLDRVDFGGGYESMAEAAYHAEQAGYRPELKLLCYRGTLLPALCGNGDRTQTNRKALVGCLDCLAILAKAKSGGVL